jgi:hypothetical protein
LYNAVQIVAVLTRFSFSRVSGFRFGITGLRALKAPSPS